MTIKGRTSEHWGRYGSRWDSNKDNGYRTRSYPSRPKPVIKGDTITTDACALLVNRPGAAERDFSLTRLGGDEVLLQLSGWLIDNLTLNARQLRFLRDQLNEWFPPE